VRATHVFRCSFRNCHIRDHGHLLEDKPEEKLSNEEQALAERDYADEVTPRPPPVLPEISSGMRSTFNSAVLNTQFRNMIASNIAYRHDLPHVELVSTNNHRVRVDNASVNQFQENHALTRPRNESSSSGK
jgi:hypothetical protein